MKALISIGAWTLVVLIVGGADICAFDYYGNGCLVDYDYTVTTKLPDGRLITTNGTECHQTIIHTKLGAEMEKKYPGY